MKHVRLKTTKILSYVDRKNFSIFAVRRPIGISVAGRSLCRCFCTGRIYLVII